ncbi:MAG: hypothetical protein RML38_11495 [Bacteroidia bacterium]|nr:hypothetical protein [Bacteroidia bacterium]
MGVPLAAQGSEHSAPSPQQYADLLGFCPQGYTQKIKIQSFALIIVRVKIV